MKKICLLPFLICATFATAAESGPPPLDGIQSLADNFLRKLSMPQTVVVRIVASDANLVSVTRSKQDRDRFVITFDRGFLGKLDALDVSAVIAHELGHVWIFTHHPYLQTEDLANQKALELVPRATLDRLYQKVGLHRGTAAAEDGSR